MEAAAIDPFEGLRVQEGSIGYQARPGEFRLDVGGPCAVFLNLREERRRRDGTVKRSCHSVAVFTFDATGRRVGFAVHPERVGDVNREALESGYAAGRPGVEQRLGYVVLRVADQVRSLDDVARLLAYPQQLPWTGEGVLEAAVVTDLDGVLAHPELPPAWWELLASPR